MDQRICKLISPRHRVMQIKRVVAIEMTFFYRKFCEDQLHMYVKMTQKMEKKKGFSRKHRLSPLSQSDESGNEMLKSWVNVKGGEKRSEIHRGMTGLGVPG